MNEYRSMKMDSSDIEELNSILENKIERESHSIHLRCMQHYKFTLI